MRAEGVEPSRPCGHRILSPARLPIPPRSQRANIIYHYWQKLYAKFIDCLYYFLVNKILTNVEENLGSIFITIN